jgi:hypothetical protein
MKENLRTDYFLVLENYRCLMFDILENLRITKLKEKVPTKSKGGRYLVFGERMSC